MRLSTKGRYAVMAMADLAQHEAANRPVSLADIAQRQEISLSYLEQLFAKLRRGGLVKSVRGPGGGYRLSRPSGDLRIADVILAVDEPIAATRCKPGRSLFHITLFREEARLVLSSRLRCHNAWFRMCFSYPVFPVGLIAEIHGSQKVRSYIEGNAHKA